MENNDLICIYCGKICKNKLSKSKHEPLCRNNPEYEKNVKVLKETTVKASKMVDVIKKNKASRRKSREKYLEEHPEEAYKDFELTCRKCGKTFVKKLKIRHFKNNYRVPQFCCQEHANSHEHSEEERKRIGNSVSKTFSKERPHTCPICGKVFMYRGFSVNTTFCEDCFKERNGGCGRKFKNSNDGREKRGVRGRSYRFVNDVPLHSQNCPMCGKIVWSKTSDIVYCYECADKGGFHRHQLYTPLGHKMYSQKTKKKLTDIVQRRIKDGLHKGWTSRNKISYAEKFWIWVLNSNGIEYKREVYVNGYFLDFVITLENGVKIDLEIDGKQHQYDDRKIHDKIRDKKNRESGYIVYRIPWLNLSKKINGIKIGSLRTKYFIRQFIWWLDKQK